MIKDNPQGYWFKRKLYGWGWTPAKWQGWCVILVYVALIFLLIISREKDVPGNFDSGSNVLIFALPIIILTILLVVVLYMKSSDTTTPPIKEFGIPRENEERRDGGCGIVFDPITQKYAVGRQTEDGMLRLFSGGVDADEDIQAGVLREVTEESGLYDFGHVEKIAEAMTHYYNSLRKVNRVAHATCFLIILKSTDTKAVHLEEHEKFTLAWATAEEIMANWQVRNENHDYDHWVYFMEEAMRRINELGI